MEYVLETRGLSKCYGQVRALWGLDMHVPAGAIYGLVGRNGAGKTTIIRLVCGLQEPTGGGYTLFGRGNRDRDIGRSRRRMGAVVETPSVYTDMTAEDNLKQQYRLLGLPDYSGLRETLETVGLADTGRKKAKNFSLGMRQRLGLAVALCGDPDLLILDEPANGLDPEGIVELRELVLRLNRERGITFIISSHILDELSKLATHYGFLDRGTLLREISARDLENACRKRLRVEVTDTEAFARVMEGLGVEYRIISDKSADIYGKLPVSRLASALGREGCEVLSASEQDETLESYYLNLVGGEHDA